MWYFLVPLFEVVAMVPKTSMPELHDHRPISSVEISFNSHQAENVIDILYNTSKSYDMVHQLTEQLKFPEGYMVNFKYLTYARCVLQRLQC